MSEDSSSICTLEEFMEGLIRRNPSEPDFHQAVYEFCESILPYVTQHPKYWQAQVLQRLTEPDRIISFRVCWLDDDNNVRVNRGYRVQHCNAIGPYKGGLRFHPDVSLGTLKFLAFEQTFKNSLTGLPMGGAKGGSDFNPKGKSDREVMAFCQAFMAELHRHIGPNTDIPAGDIGVGSREIGYLYGQYKRMTNRFTGAMTGKGLQYGGSEIRTEATGYGVVYFMQEMLKHKNMSLRGLRCLVSGSGNVAQYTAQKLMELGAVVVSLSDSSGTLYKTQGFSASDLSAIQMLKNEQRGRLETIASSLECEYFSGQSPWRLGGQLVFPCATQNELHVEDAQCLIDQGLIAVAEGANMPCTQEAIHSFLDANVIFGPSKAANAGGVAVSGLEMAQNSMRQSWSKEDLDQRLRDIMRSIHQRCLEHADDSGRTNYLKGANIAGFQKVADTLLAYGVV